VGDVAETFAVDFQDLIARFQALVPSGRAVRIHFVDQDRSLFLSFF
jgi:hypothetical protein